MSWREGEVGVLGSDHHCSCQGVLEEAEVLISFFACTNKEVVMGQVVVTHHQHMER